MLLIPDTNIFIKKPAEITSLPVPLKNYLFENLKKGHIFFVIPSDFKAIAEDTICKKHKKAYRLGFIFEALKLTYPDMNKFDKYEILSEQYHVFCTYRQFKNILDLYEENKETYFETRNNLQHLK